MAGSTTGSPKGRAQVPPYHCSFCLVCLACLVGSLWFCGGKVCFSSRFLLGTASTSGRLFCYDLDGWKAGIGRDLHFFQVARRDETGKKGKTGKTKVGAGWVVLNSVCARAKERQSARAADCLPEITCSDVPRPGDSRLESAVEEKILRYMLHLSRSFVACGLWPCRQTPCIVLQYQLKGDAQGCHDRDAFRRESR